MGDFIYSIDLSLFYAINHGMQNVIFDTVMPFITDLNKKPIVLVMVALLWLALLVKGGKNVRIAALLLIPTIAFSDQFNSSFLKHIFERVRPCHVLTDVHLLVSCGSGYSFPSSHAVNNFAGAFVLSHFIPKAKLGFWIFAVIVAYSRVYVGVHYPLDVIGGAIIGIGCGGLIVFIFKQGERFWESRRRPNEI